MTASPGDRVVRLFQTERGEVVIVAPFIKVPVCRRLLEADPEAPCTIYTRWVPAEVAAGVSDLDVLDLAEARGADVYLLRELHAKVYLRGRGALVGSANVTRAALAWGGRRNLELLVETPSTNADIVDLLSTLKSRATRADRSIQESVRRAAERLGHDRDLLLDWLVADAVHGGELEAAVSEISEHEGVGEVGDATRLVPSPSIWIPETTMPTTLLDYYVGKRRLAESVRARAERDLSYLQVAPGLGIPEYISEVRQSLRQTSLFNIVESVYDQYGTEGEAYDVFCNEVGFDHSSELSREHWRVVVDWLLHFFPDRYEHAATRTALVRKTSRPMGEYGW